MNERLILCGSEDSSICIWHRQSCELIARIKGHYQIVNSVSWSSTNALLFASGSDDTQVKLWSVQHVEAAILTNKSRKRQSQQRQLNEELNQNEEHKSGAVINYNNSRSSHGSKSDNNNSDSDSSSSSQSDDESSERGHFREDRVDMLQNIMAQAGRQHRLPNEDDDAEEEEDDDEDDEGWGDDMEIVD